MAWHICPCAIDNEHKSTFTYCQWSRAPIYIGEVPAIGNLGGAKMDPHHVRGGALGLPGRSYVDWFPAARLVVGEGAPRLPSNYTLLTGRPPLTGAPAALLGRAHPTTSVILAVSAMMSSMAPLRSLVPAYCLRLG